MAKTDYSKCVKCGLCWSICPTEAISWTPGEYPKIDPNTCMGCGACYERCPNYAITMERLPEPKIVRVDVSKVDFKKVEEICRNAGFHPEQIICFCTGTRAKEVAAAIILGAKTPEEISRMTGVRTGCKVECIQPILRLLRAVGIEPKPKPGRHAWYGICPTVFEIPKKVREKYRARGFYFDEDEMLLKKLTRGEAKV